MTQLTMPIGFIGLGAMGAPMARTLAGSGLPLIVWNRSVEKAVQAGGTTVTVAQNVADVFAQARIVVLMLADEEAVDNVLQRETSLFEHLVHDRVVVSMGTHLPAYSRELAISVEGAGGDFLEAPVSGSAEQAARGELVALLGGDDETIDEVLPVLRPLCRDLVRCGGPGDGLLMKLTINLYLGSVIASLAEAVHFANEHGLDIDVLARAIEAGPMNSETARVKLSKLARRDFSAQASAQIGYDSAVRVAGLARDRGLSTPLLDETLELLRETRDRGHGADDVVSMIRTLEARTANPN